MSIVTRRKWVAEDRDTVMRMVKAHVEAIHYLEGQQGVQHEGLGKYHKNQRSRIARKLLRRFTARTLFQFPTRSRKDCSRPTNTSRRSGLEIWNQKPEAFMDSSFIAELEKTGFIKNLSR